MFNCPERASVVAVSVVATLLTAGSATTPAVAASPVQVGHTRARVVVPVPVVRAAPAASQLKYSV
jgi:hypothetical protein